MAEDSYRYLIAGGGLAGGSAVEGIRERDAEGSILLVGAEPYLPYDRPPLTKGLWFGKKRIEQTFVHDDAFYARLGTTLALDTVLVRLDADAHTVTDDRGRVYHYDKLLLATGGIPRQLEIPGGNLEGIAYYRYLSDYLRVRRDAAEGRSALVIGGGFIGSEIAAALQTNKVNVTMLFPDAYLVSRVFPEGLGRTLTEHYRQRGVAIHAGDAPVTISLREGQFVTRTQQGREFATDLLLVGVGIRPNTMLAEQAGLTLDNGVVVNDRLQTSHPDIYAAGDLASFPYQALGKQMRVEHWDNALNQGKWAGRNMAGADESFAYMPYFFSDLFEFGYEAVGDVISKLDTFTDWQQENDTGIIYYLQDNQVRGVMLCNIYGKVENARDLIRRGVRVNRPEELAGAIPARKEAA